MSTKANYTSEAKRFIDLAMNKIDEFMAATIEDGETVKQGYKTLGFAQADLTHAKHILDGGNQDAERA